MGRMTFGARLITGMAGAALLAGASLVATAPTAAAAIELGKGHNTPAQKYANNPDATDWLGSYIVGGKQVWCVQYAHLAPDSDEQYEPGQELKTKWGTDLTADAAADISYLLLRYSDSTDADESAALAHLLHSWTAAPRTPADLEPTNTFRTVAYDAPFHLAGLPAAARTAVDRLKADASANHGPWTTEITKPTKPQVIGTPDTWTVAVRNAKNTGVKKVPVKVTLTDATVDGKTSTTLPTKDDGGPITLSLTPTGPNPTVAIALASPADRPVVQKAVQVDTQRVVSTGGEKELTGTATTTAVTAPGTASVAKVDAKTGKGIAGVSLRLTAGDKTAPAVGQDDKPLVGADGKPAVVVTGADGTVAVPNLKTPQQICLIEVAAPPGYEQGFDPAAPPTVCGEVKPGETLVLKVVNKPNVPTVPETIPAGGGPLASPGDGGGPSTTLFVGLGALVLVGSAMGGVIVLRGRRRVVVSRGMRDDWGR
ncbi:MAG: prealbumin-like fold domain-containing protein [Actinomycetota bacterium]|nr:prealbumin-like fold domain-containing protein [Actinomycetota bacterium]